MDYNDHKTIFQKKEQKISLEFKFSTKKCKMLLPSPQTFSNFVAKQCGVLHHIQNADTSSTLNHNRYSTAGEDTTEEQQ